VISDGDMDVDVTRPHIGRIYDYVLGGSYNYEPDRRAAATMIANMPAYPRWARANRAFLGRVGDLWASQGRARVLDLGSGLPTQGHFDTRLAGARVLFSDFDPLTVAQGRQLLASSPGMAYVEADVREPDALLAQADAFFGGERVLAVGCIGVLYFLSDDVLRRLMGRLHAFCAPGSTMALSFPTLPEAAVTDEFRETIREMSTVARIDFFIRTPEQIAELVAPWRMTAEPLEPPLAAAASGDRPIDRLEMFGAFAEHA
jgi:O-methyltransferase involved in polyketide biosynthesis